MLESFEIYLYDLFIAKSTATVQIALFFTYLGEVVFMAGLTLVVVVWCVVMKKAKEALWFLTTMAVAGSVVYILKNIFDRPRPEFSLINESSYSFPSGHALISTVFFLGAWFLLSKFRPDKNKIFGAISIIFILLISWSRLALGVHWTSDIIGGWGFGLIIILFAIHIYKYKIKNDQLRRNQISS